MSLYDSSNSTPVVISFSSKDRVAGTNSSFISNPIDLGINQFDSVCLVSCSIPKSFYNMPSGYNTFRLTEGARGSTTITVPIGNYTKNNLITTLATLLTAGSVAINPVGSFTYTCSYSANTGADTFKLTFGVTGNGSTTPIFTFTTSLSPFRQLGFNDGSVNTFALSGGNYILVSTNAINLQYVLRAFIKSNICRNAQDGILEEILNIGSFPTLSVAFYQQINFDMNTREFNTDNINSWQFTLVDGYDQIIDLNGIPWAFSLVFYQRNNTHELHKNDLQIKNEERLFAIESAQRNLQKQLSQPQVQSQTTTENVNLPPSVSGEISSAPIPIPQQIFPIKPFTTGIYKLPIPEIQYPQE